jgi:hypothetical protein
MLSELFLNNKTVIIVVVFILVFSILTFSLYKKQFNFLDSESEKFSEKLSEQKIVSQTDCPDYELEYKKNKFNLSVNQQNVINTKVDLTSSSDNKNVVLNNPILTKNTQASVISENNENKQIHMTHQIGIYSTSGEFEKK